MEDVKKKGREGLSERGKESNGQTETIAECERVKEE